MKKRDVLKQRKIKRRRKRKILKRIGKGVLAAAAISLATTNTVNAATINVDNSSCTLADAITSANNDTATGGCTAGSGDDTIVLPNQSTITLTTPLPDITSTVTIQGNSSTVERDPNASSEFRIFTNSNNNGSLTLENMTIKGGKAHIGGGILNNGNATLIINNCTISGNEATWIGGGVASYNAGDILLTNSTVTDNIGDKGGGVGGSGANVTLINSTISANKGNSGGALYVGYLAYFTIKHSTITKNEALTNDGPSAIATDDYYVYIHNSIVASNVGGVGNCDPNDKDYIYLYGNNWFDDTTCTGSANSGNLNLDPNLKDNGGPTKTHALLSGSDAIDAASDCFGVTTDQRGVSRPIDGNGDGTSACDIGAFENQLPDAVDDTASTDEDTPVDIPVTSNDDFGGDGPGSGPITITAAPSHGTATVNDNGTPDDPTDDSIVYTPDAGYYGSDSLEYRIEDSNGDIDVARVNINVNAKPTAEDDQYTVYSNSQSSRFYVLNNDSFGGDGPSIITIITPPLHGTATVNDNGTPNDPLDDYIEYTPDADYQGNDSFEYQICDADNNCTTARVNVNVHLVTEVPSLSVWGRIAQIGFMLLGALGFRRKQK